MISHGEPIGHDDIFGKEWSAIGFPLQVVVLRIVVGSLKMFGPVGYSIFDDPLPSSVLFCSFCNANWANQHFGFLSQSSPDDGQATREYAKVHSTIPWTDAERWNGGQGQNTLAGPGYCCCGWGQKETKDIGKAFVLSIIMSGRGGVFHHTHGSPATSELSTTGGQLL